MVLDTDVPVFLQHTRSGTFFNEELSSELLQPPIEVNSSAHTNMEAAIEFKEQPENDNPIKWKNISHLKGHFSFREEEKRLVELYDERMSRKTHKSNLIVIDGPTGCGKTQFAETLRHFVEGRSGYFLIGKFDPLQPDPPKPYAAFVTAIEAFTADVITRGEEEAILNDCASLSAEDIAILTGMVPALERLFGRLKTHKAKGDSRPGGYDRLRRFVLIFLSFLRAISSENRPIVMLLKGMQWADPCSCNLLDAITRESRVNGLLCIATMDTSIAPECCADQSSTCFLRSERVATIKLRNLDHSQVLLYLSQFFEGSQTGTNWNDFADMIYLQTKGNFLYMTMFLEMLVASNALINQEGKWIFIAEAIQERVRDASLSSFFGASISLELSHQSLEILKVGACLGSEFDARLIETVIGYPVDKFLEESASRGYITITKNGYAFAHDCFQQAAYNLIPQKERDVFHVEIGRRIWRSMDSEEKLEANLYTILSQFSRGKHLLKRDKERVLLATLSLQAGQKAAKASAFRTAVSYLELGIFILMDQADKKLRWKKEYDLTLALYNAAAEMNLVTSQYERSEQLVQDVLLYAKAPLDKIRANGTRICIFGTLSKQQEAINVGLNALEELGESFPRRRLKLHMLLELSTVRRMLRGKSDEQLMRLEPINDTTKHSCLQIMYLIYVHCLLTQPELGVLVGLRSLKITLKYGLSPFSSSSFAIFGMVCLFMKDIDAAYRFGRLGLKLLDSYGVIEYLPRVYAAYYGVIETWKRPIKDSLQPLLRAHHVGLHTGDREFAFLCSNCYIFHAYHSGIRLEEIMCTWRSIVGDMASSRQESLLQMSLPFVQSILLLMNSSREEALSFKGEVMDMLCEHELAHKSGRSAIASSIMNSCAMIAYTFDDLTQADKFATWVDRYGGVVPTFEEVFRQFFRALISFALIRQNTNRRKNFQIGRRICRQFATIFSLKSPDNCCDKQHLLEAELASVSGQGELACAHYKCAIALAEKSEFLLEQALAHERLGFHLHNLGDSDASWSHLQKAVSLYNIWGAKGKARYLQSVISCTISQP